VKRILLGLSLALTGLVAVPSVAAAAELQVAHDHTRVTAEQRRTAREGRRDDRNKALARRRPDLEDYQLEPQRKGLYAGAGLYTGFTASTYGFIPSIGHRLEIGGGITDRLTIGIAGGIAGHQGMRKGTAGVADLVVTYFPIYGLYGRAGFGVTSHAPWRGGADKPYPALPRRAGVGGMLGVGWEFRPLEHMALALGVDYEGRMRADGLYVQAFTLNVTLRGYFHPKKH
jgi:hypothetical protein